MKNIALVSALALGLSVSGCGGQIGAFVEKETGLTPVQQASIASKVPCLLPVIVAAANGIAIDARASQGVQSGFGVATNISNDVCVDVGGILQAAK